MSFLSEKGRSTWAALAKPGTEIAEINEIKIEEPLKSGKCLILEKKVVLAD